MPDINVITPFSVDGTRSLPLGPELRGIGGSEFKIDATGPVPINNNNLEEEFLFGTSKFVEKWFDETNHCYRERITFGYGKGEPIDSSKYKYILEYYEYDTQPEKYDATISASQAGVGNLKLTLDYHKRIFNAGNKVYKLYHTTEDGTRIFCCKKTITQTVNPSTGKCTIKKVISDTDN